MTLIALLAASRTLRTDRIKHRAPIGPWIVAAIVFFSFVGFVAWATRPGDARAMGTVNSGGYR